jgi:hypothetical protein
MPLLDVGKIGNLVMPAIRRVTKNNVLIPKNIPIGEVGGLTLKNVLFSPSSILTGISKRIPLPGIVKSAFLPTSTAGSVFSLLSLEGDTPQSENPYARWRKLGYDSEQDMKTRVGNKTRPIGSQARLGGKPVRWTGTKWEETNLEDGTPLVPVSRNRPPADPTSDQELPIGAFVNSSLPRPPIPESTPRYGMAPDVERAYQRERNRIRQLAAQNPALPQTTGYLPVASQEEQDRRILAWAAANPDLAAQLTQNQYGYQAIDESRDY